MTKLVLSLSILTTVFSIESAVACSRPPQSVLQLMNLNQVLDSNEFITAMNEQLKNNVYFKIESLKMERNIVSASLNNGCIINAAIEYGAPPQPGLCPVLKGINVETICE